MNLFQNPFYIIGVSTRDTKQKIVEACDAKSLTVDSELNTKIRSTLTQPRNRLSAELAWLPGIAPRRAVGLVDKLRMDPATFLADLGDVPPLARCNALTTYINQKIKNEDQLVEILIDIIHS